MSSVFYPAAKQDICVSWQQKHIWPFYLLLLLETVLIPHVQVANICTLKEREYIRRLKTAIRPFSGRRNRCQVTLAEKADCTLESQGTHRMGTEPSLSAPKSGTMYHCIINSTKIFPIVLLASFYGDLYTSRVLRNRYRGYTGGGGGSGWELVDEKGIYLITTQAKYLTQKYFRKLKLPKGKSSRGLTIV